MLPAFRPIFLLSALAVLLHAGMARNAHAQNLLLNGGFESPAQSGAGNHLGVRPDKWTVDQGDAASNIGVGTPTSPTGGGTPFAAAYEGTQYFDGVGDVTLRQTFTLGVTAPLAISFAIGGRDATPTNQITTVTLFNSANTAAYTSGALTVSQGVWRPINFQTPTAFSPGNYTFTIALANPHDFDAAVVTAVVPEPGTPALVGGALLLGVAARQVTRRRV